VLKVSFVDEETQHEPDALRSLDGDGAVRWWTPNPLGRAPARTAGARNPLGDHPDRAEAIGIACALLSGCGDRFRTITRFRSSAISRRGWRTSSSGASFDRIGPFDERLLRTAVDLCRDLSASSEEAVLANRDFHLWNVLAAQREAWLVIDPKPLVGERAFDTGHLVRTLLPQRFDLSSVDAIVGRLATELELEPAHIYRWGVRPARSTTPSGACRSAGPTSSGHPMRPPARPAALGPLRSSGRGSPLPGSRRVRCSEALPHRSCER
jgi:hypothetical protein